MSILERVKAALPALPPAEQRVAKLLLADARSFASLPVSELADRSHVSKPTVVRFCRSVGYDGLADFKLKLAGSVNEGVPFVHRAVDEDDKPSDIIVKVVDNAVAALLHYRNDAASHAFERAIDALAESARHGRRIEFYGVGNSGIVAQDAQHKFFRLGVNTVATSDGHVQLMSATMLQQGDCAVIISNSGRSRDLLDAAEIARKKGATIIIITASASPLAQLALGCLVHGSGCVPPCLGFGARPSIPVHGSSWASHGIGWALSRMGAVPASNCSPVSGWPRA